MRRELPFINPIGLDTKDVQGAYRVVMNINAYVFMNINAKGIITLVDLKIENENTKHAHRLRIAKAYRH